MKLDWKTRPVPGKSMFNLELRTGYADVVNLLRGYEIADGIIQLANADPMRMDMHSNEGEIRFKTIKDGNYDWQSDVALLYFEAGNLKSITTYLNEPHSYRGLICGQIGLGEQILELKKYFTLEYNFVDEVFYAFSEGELNGLELHGSSCDLSVDPTQKIAAIKVFITEP